MGAHAGGERPLVSVVLPVRDGLPWIEEAIGSVLRQTLDRWELVVVDDGSTDGTAGYLAGLDDPRIRRLSLPCSRGPSTARNRAIRAARAPRVAFLDADDAFLPGKLERQLAALEAQPHASWSCTGFSRIDRHGQPLDDPGVGRWHPRSGELLRRLATLEAIVPTPTVMADRPLLDAVGGFDESLPYCEEYDLWLRLAAASPLAAVPEPLVLVRSRRDGYARDREGVHRCWVEVHDRLASRCADPSVRRIARREAARHAVSAAVHARRGGHAARAWRHWLDGMRRRPWSPAAWRFLLGRDPGNARRSAEGGSRA